MSASLSAPLPTPSERESVDEAALRLMLAYVEAECLRLGATDAARHAAMAAALMPPPSAAAPAAAAASAAGRRARTPRRSGRAPARLH